jgi:F0F1-type ATP synthase, delta subunit (mitochondrial oligomycin sensitivity protein)
MTNRVAAMRYARALLEISEKDSDPEQVEREVASFVELMDAHPILGSCLVNPSIAPAKKTAVMIELLPRIGGVSDITKRLLTMLATRDRLVILKEILEVYRQQLRNNGASCAR